MPLTCVMTMRPAHPLRWLITACAVASAGATIARAAPLAGRFSSPLGVVAVVEKAGEVTGTVADAKNPCGMKKGQVVLQGSRLDDSIVGTLHACKIGEGCAGAVEGAAMLLITKGGNVLSGAVHVEAGTCKTPLGGDSVVFRRVGQPAVAGAGSPVAKGNARQRAEALAREALNLLNQSEGNVELARQKLQQSVVIDPEYAEGYNGVGVTFFMRDRYDEALDWYKKALTANPGIGDAYYNMGCVYAVKGEKEQALRYLRIALLNGYVQLDTLTVDPTLKSLHGDAGFEKLKQGITDDAPTTPLPAPVVDAGPAPADPASSIDRAPGK